MPYFDNFPGKAYKMAETGRELANDLNATFQPTAPKSKVSVPPDIIDAINGEIGPSAKAIASAGLDLIQMLLDKNKSYGDSARNPVAVFATGIDTKTRMGVRMDDKLSRLMRGDKSVFEDENTLNDLAGYLILLLSLDY